MGEMYDIDIGVHLTDSVKYKESSKNSKVAITPNKIILNF